MYPFKIAIALLCTAAVPAVAQDTLSLGQLLREALNSNPEILAAQKRYEAAKQRPSGEQSTGPDVLARIRQQWRTVARSAARF